MHVFSLTVQVGGRVPLSPLGGQAGTGAAAGSGALSAGALLPLREGSPRGGAGRARFPPPRASRPPRVRWLRGSSALRGPQEGLLLEGGAGLKNCEESTSRASLDASLLLKDGRGAPPSADASEAAAGEPAPLRGGCCMLARPVSSAWQGAPAGDGRLRTWSSAPGVGHTGRGAAAWGRADLGDSGWGCS